MLGGFKATGGVTTVKSQDKAASKKTHDNTLGGELPHRNIHQPISVYGNVVQQRLGRTSRKESTTARFGGHLPANARGQF